MPTQIRQPTDAAMAWFEKGDRVASGIPHFSAMRFAAASFPCLPSFQTEKNSETIAQIETGENRFSSPSNESVARG